jgi:hypothetical protein
MEAAQCRGDLISTVWNSWVKYEAFNLESLNHYKDLWHLISYKATQLIVRPRARDYLCKSACAEAEPDRRENDSITEADASKSRNGLSNTCPCGMESPKPHKTKNQVDV